MNEQLKERLRAPNLLPIALDEKAQEFYRQQGRDPSTIETHRNPNTPPYMIELFDAISEAVARLHQMETEGQADSEDYRTTEESLRENLDLLPPPNSIRVTFSHEPATGVSGVYRDPQSAFPSGLVDDFYKIKPSD